MSIESLLDRPLDPWMGGGGQDGDIVLSSRIRLARNMDGIPFPNRANVDQLADVVEKVRESVGSVSAADSNVYDFIELAKLPALERYVLVEKHVISPNHAQEPENRALVVRDDASVVIMVNEEDHMRIQCMMPGLNLNEALVLANSIDDAVESKIDIAFSEQMGYLTSCPTNLGTGLRASVMVHLPALVITRQMGRIVHAVTQLGLTVRGLYGEGSEAVGNMFQISNQLTLGYTEQEIVANLHSVVGQVVDHERTARGVLFAESQDTLADRIWRAYGVLRYARSISGQEALALLSEVRLGIDLEIIKQIPAQIFNELLVTTRPNFLQRLAARTDFEPAERNRLRAQLIREKISGGGSNV